MAVQDESLTRSVCQPAKPPPPPPSWLIPEPIWSLDACLFNCPCCSGAVAHYAPAGRLLLARQHNSRAPLLYSPSSRRPPAGSGCFVFVHIDPPASAGSALQCYRSYLSHDAKMIALHLNNCCYVQKGICPEETYRHKDHPS